jgi:hypothetical protein
MVGDAGGLGAGYIDEAQKRFKLPIEAAEKTEKLAYIRLMNGELERSHIKVVESECQPLITEWLELPWDEDAKTGREKEAEGFDNHCADGCLYAWRRTHAYAQENAMLGEPLGTPEMVQKAHDARKKAWLIKRRKDQERERKFGRRPVTHTMRPS